MTDNSHLFKGGRKRPSQPPYKRVEVITIATTLPNKGRQGGHFAVVLIRKDKTTYEAQHLEVFPLRIDALQRAHYINANKILRSDGAYFHLSTEPRTLAELKELGYSL